MRNPSPMIDLHCHMLPGIDDGPRDLATSLAMARVAVADGITLTACTPHIYPGLYENTATTIQAAADTFRHHLRLADIPLDITTGADIQLVPELMAGLRSGRFPTLHGSRYFLFEPPHHTVPPRFLDSIFDALSAGFIPVITHPERLTWLDDKHYGWFQEAARQGAWIQVTAGALTGRFRAQPQYWAERFLDEGLVHLLATDAHHHERRPPLLAEGREAAAKWVGQEEAERLVSDRPQAIIANRDPTSLIPPPGLGGPTWNRPSTRPGPGGGWLSRLLGGRAHRGEGA